MRLTNKHKLPKPFLNLFQKQEYSKGHARISVTELINSPRIVALKNQYRDDIEEDVVDKFWALMGTNIHRILQEGADEEHLAEERLFMDVDGWMVSGAIDLQRSGEDGVDLIDWKFTSAYSVMSYKADWERQLNCYAHLVRKVKGVEPAKLYVCAIVRDWDKRKASYEHGKGYPQSPVALVPIRKWLDHEADLFVRDRVRVHRDAQRANEWGEELPLCTDDERWSRDRLYAVHRARADGPGGNHTRAVRVFPSAQEAGDYVARSGRDGLVVVERPGEPVRCVNNYCGVAPWCNQYQKEK